MAQLTINYTATADIKNYSYNGSTWNVDNIDQNASTWDSVTGEGVLVLNEGITALGQYAFRGCTALTSVSFGDGITNTGDSAFEGCSNNTSIDFGNTITTIDNNSFHSNTSLTSVEIPDNITSAGTGAFAECRGITSLTFGTGMTAVNYGVSYNCVSLTKVTCKATTPPYVNTWNFQNSGDTLYVPFESLQAYQSSSWNSLFTNVKAIPSVINYTATADLKSFSTWLTNNVDQSLSTWDSTTQEGVLVLNSGVTEIGASAFLNCTALTNIVLSEGIDSIKSDAFNGCTNITIINLPNSVTSLGDGCFAGCSSLESFNFNSGLISIGNNVFHHNRLMTSVELPDSVTTVGTGAFAECSGLTSMTFGTGITNINYGATNFCSNITTVICKATTPPSLGTYNFQASDDTLYVPSAAKSTYENNTNWRNAFTTIAGIYNLTTSVSGSGSISPSEGPLYEGTDVTLTITPDEGYGIFSVTDNGTPVQVTLTGMTYTISNIATDHTITVVFKPLFTITTSAGEGGSITPTTEVFGGESFTVTATPNAHYKVSHFVVDGVDVGTVDNYTFQNLDANHTIHVDFELITHTITATASTGGSISPSGSVTVNEGTDQTFTITPNAHYYISDVTVDGVSVGAVSTYTFTDVEVAHTINATFTQYTHTITATAFEGGAIVPSGAITVNEGENQSFDIISLEGYGILAVFIDGTQIESVETYTFTDVEADHTIDAMFYTLQTAGFNRDEMLDIDYLLQDYLEQLKKRD